MSIPDTRMTLNISNGQGNSKHTGAAPYVAILTLLLALVAACSDEDLHLSDSTIKSNSYAEMTSTTALELSTFRLDSVLTSSQNRVWVGRAQKQAIGTICSESYLRLDEPKLPGATAAYYGWNGNQKEIYDSCTIVLKHTGQFECAQDRDTIQPFEIRVECLAQKLEFADENESDFYNVRSFPADSLLGSFVFKPRPHSRPRLRFRLNDTFGQHLVEFIKSQVNLSTKDVEQNYDKFMKGIKISSSDDVQALLGFYADSTMICLHSHIRGFQAVKVERQFKMTGANLQFNNVWNEGADEPFSPETLYHRYVQVAEDSADLQSVMYEGLGYYTRVNFPSIESLKNLSKYQHIVKAVLKLYPKVGSYDKNRIPTTFYLHEVNKGNVITNSVINSAGGNVHSTLVYDAFDRSEMYYYADITYYINTILSKDLVDENNGLVLTWGTGMEPTNYNFMIFNGHGVDLHRSVLEVTFYNFDREER